MRVVGFRGGTCRAGIRLQQHVVDRPMAVDIKPRDEVSRVAIDAQTVDSNASIHF